MKILICSVSGKSQNDPFLTLLPVGIGSLVAMLRKSGYHARAANFHSIPLKKIKSILEKEEPDLLGISVMTHNRHDSLRLAKLAKTVNPSCHVTLGGPHATHRAEEILAICPSVDSVVLGEGEETLLELVRLLASDTSGNVLSTIRSLVFRDGMSIIRNTLRPPIEDLDTLPSPYLGFEGGINIDVYRQNEFIITSRGCPAACSFCSSPHFWGKSLRFRSPRSMINELRDLQNRYGIIYFSIRDDTFTSDRKRVIEFCQLMLQERLYILWNCQSRVNAVDEEMLLWLRRAGCDCIQYGLESGSPAVLKYLGKQICQDQILQATNATRKAGIRLSVYLITGIPEETENDLDETISLLKEVRADDGQVSPLAYFPGTRLFTDAVRRGGIPADLFERSVSNALYVMNASSASVSANRLLTALKQFAPSDAQIVQESAEVSRSIGYCHGLNVTRGELMAANGDYAGAETEFMTIARREPGNPWGWLLLGELYQQTGGISGAIQAFENLAELVPAHLPAWETLADLYRINGNRVKNLECRQRAIHERNKSC